MIEYDDLPEGAWVLEPYEEFAPAILGVCVDSLSVCYSLEKIIEIVAESMRQELTTDELQGFEVAREYVEFNILRAYMGKGAPLFIESIG